MESILRFGGWAAVILVVVSSLAPSHLRPHLLANGQLEHLIAYGLVATLLAVACGTKRHFLTVCVSLPLCAAPLEILQNFVPGRRLSRRIPAQQGLSGPRHPPALLVIQHRTGRAHVPGPA